MKTRSFKSYSRRRVRIVGGKFNGQLENKRFIRLKGEKKKRQKLVSVMNSKYENRKVCQANEVYRSCGSGDRCNPTKQIVSFRKGGNI
jgi:hypothetical protein